MDARADEHPRDTVSRQLEYFWNAGCKRGQKDAGLGVIRVLVYLGTLGPGMVSPTWKETGGNILVKGFNPNNNSFRVGKDFMKVLILSPYNISTRELLLGE